MKKEFPLLTTLVLNGELPAVPPGCKLVDAQEATDRYWYDENDVWEFDKDFGCMAPPYPLIWLESTAHIPIGAAKNGKVAADRQDSRVGYKMDCHEKDTFSKIYGRYFAPGVLAGHEFKWGWTVQVFVDSMPGLIKHRVPALGFLFLDSAGTPTVNGRVTIFEGSVTKDQETVVRHAVWGPAKAAFFAVSMMNCRNVTMSTNVTSQRGGKKSRRKGMPSVEYKSIHLPRKSGTASISSGELTGTQKLHTARGHFKTYTTEAPLMGRHVGTYYWGWQVRGSRTNGEIVSSYNVGVTP